MVRPAWMLLRRPRWLVLLAVVLILAALFIRLGFWQLDRLQQRRAVNQVVSASRAQPPAPLAEVMTPAQTVGSDTQYRRVSVRGEYKQDSDVLVRNRTVDDRVGFFVLTPLLSAAGTIFIARGWLPPNSAGANQAPTIPAAPTGEVNVIGRLRSNETETAIRPTTLDGLPAVTRINAKALARTAEQPAYHGYLELVQQVPRNAKAFIAIPAPKVEEGPHLSYAVQWFSFAAIAVFGFGFLLFRTARRAEVTHG